MENKIEYASKQAEKIISAYGIGSEYSYHAIFVLQALQSGMGEIESFNYAADQMEALRNLNIKGADQS